MQSLLRDAVGKFMNHAWITAVKGIAVGGPLVEEVEHGIIVVDQQVHGNSGFRLVVFSPGLPGRQEKIVKGSCIRRFRTSEGSSPAGRVTVRI